MADKYPINLKENERAQRKKLITVAEWDEDGSQKRAILGRRTEESSMEFNPDTETMTDILGITHTDINKTEPSQPMTCWIMGGDDLSAYLVKAALRNDIDAYNGKFTVYVITAFMGTEGDYYAVKHSGCTIQPENLGGSSYTQMDVTINYSNNITEGSVDKLTKDFVFTAKASSTPTTE